MMLLGINLTSKKFQIIFFGVLILLGLFIFRDYGMSWDEQYQRDSNGRLVHNYVFHNEVEPYLSSAEKYHGPAIEWPLYSLERVFQLTDSREIYLFRHLSIFFLFLISSIYFYRLSVLIYNSNTISQIAFLFYVFTPRILSDSFYNSKDIGAVSLFTIALYFCLKWINTLKFKEMILAGLFSGLLVAVRLPCLILPIFIGFYFYFSNVNKARTIAHVLGYLLFTFFITILVWPIMWSDTFSNLLKAWEESARFVTTNKVLFFGELISSSRLPWNYVLVWIVFTTPTIVLVLIGIAIPMVFFDNLKFRNRIADNDRHILAITLLLILIILFIVLLKPTLYDGWRHMYFIHPLMILVALSVLNVIRQKLSVKIYRRCSLIILGCFLPVIIWMVNNHPYQNLYFNQLTKWVYPHVMIDFDRDYWGLSYREGIEKILERDSQSEIRIMVDNAAGKLGSLLVNKANRQRVIFVDKLCDADYFIGNYRERIGDYTFSEKMKWYDLKVDDTRVMTIYKFK